MKLTGAEIVVACLKEQEVDTVFGYPGGTILNVYDALYKHSDEIRHILTSHEQGAAHAADGYARATGKVGVCLATSGPGATNLVTGIATAYMDSVPMVAITCNVNLPLLGKDSFQEVDIAGVTMPITKHGYIVKDVSILADTIRKAFAIARSGRPGPVLVDITKDVTAAQFEYQEKKPEALPVKKKYEEEDIEKAVALMKEAKKPYIYVGGGAVISGAYQEVRKLSGLLDAPVCDTLMAKGVMDGHSDYYTGMIGMHGTKTSNFGVSECDLLVALGARFSDRVVGNASAFAKNAKVLHIDIDAAEINKNIHSDAFVVGDLKEVLTKINEKLPEQEHPEWIAHIKELKEKYPLSYDHSVLSCPYIMEEIDKATEGKAIITTDVGQHQMWAALHLRIEEPRTWLTSGGLGTMGFGLPAAMGAQLYYGKDRRVIHVAGDGGIKMTGNEFYTIARLNLPVVSLIVNNRSLGMIRQLQKVMYKERYIACELDYPMDYVKYAECFGIQAESVSTQDEFAEALKKALEDRDHPRVIVLNVWRSFVEPMIKGGARIDEFVEFK